MTMARSSGWMRMCGLRRLHGRRLRSPEVSSSVQELSIKKRTENSGRTYAGQGIRVVRRVSRGARPVSKAKDREQRHGARLRTLFSSSNALSAFLA